MTGTPNVKSKNTSFKPKTPEDEKIIRDFKRLANQDGIPIHDLYVEAFQLLFRVHHWPPGNPQLTLESSLQTKIVSLGRCEFAKCRNQAVRIGIYLPKNKEYKLCPDHMKVGQKDPKQWRLKEEKVGS